MNVLQLCQLGPRPSDTIRQSSTSGVSHQKELLAVRIFEDGIDVAVQIEVWCLLVK